MSLSFTDGLPFIDFSRSVVRYAVYFFRKNGSMGVKSNRLMLQKTSLSQTEAAAYTTKTVLIPAFLTLVRIFRLWAKDVTLTITMIAMTM